MLTVELGRWPRSATTMDHQSKITTAAGHGIKAGDWISLTVPDGRWWRRLAYWLLRRGKPTRTINRRVSQASSTTLTL